MSKFWKKTAHLYAELRRRKVVRAAIAYAVFAGGAIQFWGPIEDGLKLPDWTLTAVIIAAAIGFPIVIILTWAFEITRDTADNDDEAAEPQFGDRPVVNAAPVYHVDKPFTQLVGREADLNEGLRLLADPQCRILTITGPGGIGKTRLAQEIAGSACKHYANGVCFVPLAGVESVDAMPAALADALGFSFSGHDSTVRQLAGFVQEKKLLLVLDNFEQIVDGAALLADIIARAPGVRALVTSRRRLRLASEAVLQLDSLPLPRPNRPLEESAAARLFLQVAKRNDPHFKAGNGSAAAIVRICEIAGGIPLAIELAASTVGVLTVDEIANELAQSHELVLGARRDLPARHQSLNAAFESSWRLLDTNERRAFRRLSVFRTGFDGEAAREVAAAELQLLARLVEVSLVRRPAHGAFEILEVLRQFGEEKLDSKPTEAAEVRARHSAYFLAQLAQAATVEDGTKDQLSLDQLAQHYADLRAAWLRAADDGRHEDLRRALPNLYRFLEARGRSVEGVDLFGRAIEAVRTRAGKAGTDGAAAKAALARLLTRHAAFLIETGEISEADDSLTEGLASFRDEGDRAEIAFALQKKATIARLTGDFFSPVFEESLALFRELGDLPGVARALNAWGSARQSRGEYDEAKRLYQESIDLFRRIGLEGEAWPAINNLAGIARLEGDSARARKILEDELNAARKRNNPRALSFLLTNLGLITSKAGDLEASRQYLAESVRLSREMGYRSRLAYCLNTLACVHMQSGDIPAAAGAFRDALSVAVDAEEGPLVPAILVEIARLHLLRNEPDRAALILTAVEADEASDDETRTDARVLLAEIEPRLTARPRQSVPLEAAIQSALELETSVLSA